jgi:hypothetical protein
MAVAGRIRLERRHSRLNDITNRLACLGPGLHIVVVIKNATGGQGIVGWSVIPANLEPNGMVLVPAEESSSIPR